MLSSPFWTVDDSSTRPTQAGPISLSWLDRMASRSLCTLRSQRRRWTTQHSVPAGSLRLGRAGPSPAEALHKVSATSCVLLVRLHLAQPKNPERNVGSSIRIVSCAQVRRTSSRRMSFRRRSQATARSPLRRARGPHPDRNRAEPAARATCSPPTWSLPSVRDWSVAPATVVAGSFANRSRPTVGVARGNLYMTSEKLFQSIALVQYCIFDHNNKIYALSCSRRSSRGRRARCRRPAVSDRREREPHADARHALAVAEQRGRAPGLCLHRYRPADVRRSGISEVGESIQKLVRDEETSPSTTTSLVDVDVHVDTTPRGPTLRFLAPRRDCAQAARLMP
jgi:hypothetical protein